VLTPAMKKFIETLGTDMSGEQKILASRAGAYFQRRGHAAHQGSGFLVLAAVSMHDLLPRFGEART